MGTLTANEDPKEMPHNEADAFIRDSTVCAKIISFFTWTQKNTLI